jgi:putative ABC transport system ATP-binding protein
MPDLDIRDLTIEYSSGDALVRPVDSLDLSARSGELVVLLGPSGSGKTTILSCLAGILTPTSGTISLDGRDVTKLQGPDLTEHRRHTVGIVFQGFNLIPSLSAVENVEAGMRLGGVPRARARARATELLEQFDMAERAGHRPGQLSGGQQQRVAICRALAHDPPLVLADEPTANLDYIQAESVITAVRGLAAPGRLVVVATHDERLVPLADRVIELTANFRDLSRPPERVHLSPGQSLFEQGERGELVYAIESGTIDIVRIHGDRSEERLATLGGGEYFGELGPLFGLPRSASARASSDAVVVGYTVRDFRRLFGAEATGGPDVSVHATPSPKPAGAPRFADVVQASKQAASVAAAWWRGGRPRA